MQVSIEQCDLQAGLLWLETSRQFWDSQQSGRDEPSLVNSSGLLLGNTQLYNYTQNRFKLAFGRFVGQQSGFYERLT